MNSVQLKVGALEIRVERDGEITPEYLEDLLPICSKMAIVAPTMKEDMPGDRTAHKSADTYSALADLSINALAAKMQADSCSQLLKAASFQLFMESEGGVFNKDALTSLVREARLWKAAYSNQQSRDLKRLESKGWLIERKSGEYTLSRSAEDELKELIYEG